MEELHFVDACREEHFATMSLFHALGWRTTYQNQIPADYIAQEITDERWIPMFRENYETGRNHGLLLYKGDTPVSCITYGPIRTDSGLQGDEVTPLDTRGREGWWEIISFYSHPDHKGKGYGSMLVDELFRRLRGQGCPGVVVFAMRENMGARRFYERHGFYLDGVSVDLPFPHNVVTTDLRYSHPL